MESWRLTLGSISAFLAVCLAIYALVALSGKIIEPPFNKVLLTGTEEEKKRYIRSANGAVCVRYLLVAAVFGVISYLIFKGGGMAVILCCGALSAISFLLGRNKKK
ncbi:MAG: hypothetical protein IJR47_02705 [Clostridia bacterium]|nr:hypothetical protein [Clostridia bacterium]